MPLRRTRDVDNFIVSKAAGRDALKALGFAIRSSGGDTPTSWCAPSFSDFGYLAEMPPPLVASLIFYPALFRIDVCKLDVPTNDMHYIA